MRSKRSDDSDAITRSEGGQGVAGTRTGDCRDVDRRRCGGWRLISSAGSNSGSFFLLRRENVDRQHDRILQQIERELRDTGESRGEGFHRQVSHFRIVDRSLHLEECRREPFRSPAIRRPKSGIDFKTASRSRRG